MCACLVVLDNKKRTTSLYFFCLVPCHFARILIIMNALVLHTYVCVCMCHRLIELSPCNNCFFFLSLQPIMLLYECDRHRKMQKQWLLDISRSEVVYVMNDEEL